MDERDSWLLLATVGLLVIGQLLHSRMLRKLYDDVQFLMDVPRETKVTHD